MTSRLLVIGGGLFGSQAAAYARARGLEVLFSTLPGLLAQFGGGRPFQGRVGRQQTADHFRAALPLLDRLFGIRHISLLHRDEGEEPFLFVPPAAILERNPMRDTVSAVGDGWLEAGGKRYEGSVYLAAGIWCSQFLAELEVHGRSGTAFLFKETAHHAVGRIRPLALGRQAIAFGRDPGSVYFSDGTAERIYSAEHDHQTLARSRCHGADGAARDGLCTDIVRIRRVDRCSVAWVCGTWLATGGRKMGTIIGVIRTASDRRRVAIVARPSRPCATSDSQSIYILIPRLCLAEPGNDMRVMRWLTARARAKRRVTDQFGNGGGVEELSEPICSRTLTSQSCHSVLPQPPGRSRNAS